MLSFRRGLLLAPLALAVACGSRAPVSQPPPLTTATPVAPADTEPHLDSVRRLTFGGENAEAYWSWDGTQLIFQAREGATGQECDRIYRMNVDDDPPRPIPVSSGKGATTCSYFMPGDQEVIYASTHLAGDACPPRADRSHGYVWALHPSFDIFRANLDGTNVRRLTDAPGYDAEGTVCKKDGSIVFTSVRDGDLELYRMNGDGSNVKRLTHTPGYDGGAFFDDDCTHLVWRASRPKPGKELDEFRALLAQNLVRPTKLEIYTGTLGDDGLDDVRQVTYLDAASFAPFWHPSQRRILFSSNVGSKTGREFDIWAVDAPGTRLERVTTADGFDGFPMFSPDGKTLAFSSNRKTAEGHHDTDVFLARWKDTPPIFDPTPADHILADVTWLADPAREGRGIGTRGLDEAGAWIEQRMRYLGLDAAGDSGSYRQAVPVTTGVQVGPTTHATFGGVATTDGQLAPFGFSASAKAEGQLAFAGYGIVSKEDGLDDYARLDVKDKVVLVRRFAPPSRKDSAAQRLGDVRHKAWLARERGARALVVVDVPEGATGAAGANGAGGATTVPDAPLPEPTLDGPPDDAGIPVVAITRAVGAPLLARLSRGEQIAASVEVLLAWTTTPAFNVVGRLRAAAPNKLDGVVVVGAHYDHLGMGGSDSLAPGVHAPHLGADDNASGTATILEVARAMAEHPEALRRDVVFVAFTGEERGDLGSTVFTKTPPAGLAIKDIVGMLNLDMVGRLRDNTLSVRGGETAAEWSALVPKACDEARVECTVGGDGYGPSDHAAFSAAGVPVLFFFTGAHADYHRPSDTADKINAAGAGQIARIVEGVASAVSTRDARLTLVQTSSRPPTPSGDVRHSHASLGTVPDYSGVATGTPGMRIAGVRPGGPADKAGIARGDILVKLGGHVIGSVEDLVYALDGQQPGDVVEVVVVRDGKSIKLTATLTEAHRR